MNLQKYRCLTCGNIVEVLHTGTGTLVCCGQPMQLITENTNDQAAIEKHVPIISALNPQQTLVQVGSTPHPMTEEHYIEWIEIITKEQQVLRCFLQPNMEPKAIFNIPIEQILYAKEYCNLHGYWTSNKTMTMLSL